MVHVQTGNMLDVIVEGKSLGLKQRGNDQVIWLPDPEGLRDVLTAEINRLTPPVTAVPAKCVKCGHQKRFFIKGNCEYLTEHEDRSATACMCQCEFPAPAAEQGEKE